MIWTIGNGESRSNIAIDCLDGIKIGCNAIFRDCQVDHLICVDRRMVNEAIVAGINNDTYIYTRHDWISGYRDQKKIREVPELPYVGSERPDLPWHWGSGPYAVLLAAKLAKDTPIAMLGFDLYSDTGLVNNIYKGTGNYDHPEKKAIDPSYWIYQIGKVFQHKQDTQFKVYNRDNWELPQAWKYPNVTLDKISTIV